MKFVATKKGMTTKFFSPLSFVAVFGSGIRDPGSGMGMGKNQDPGSGINIPDLPHCIILYLVPVPVPLVKKLRFRFRFHNTAFLPH